MTRVDIAIVGAGMAGASLAAAIGDAARVLLLEAEDAPGYHATGRSAAFWTETYGGPSVQPLTTASGPWLRAPPADYGGETFLGPRGALHLGRGEDRPAIDRLAAECAVAGVGHIRVDPTTMIAGLRPDWTEGLAEPSCADIDVARLHAACLSRARACGVELRTGARLHAATRENGRWRIETSAGAIDASILVNAAGAWADAAAIAAGAAPLGIRPYRRTIAQLRVDPPAPADLPLVIDIAERFYFKPDTGGRLWLSPHDETPADPGDAAPEEIDVALAIDRLQQVVDWRVVAVERRWAGLRSFAPDRLPVYGFDARAPGFFWFAGQGGFGIQTAPAAAAQGAALLLGRALEGVAATIDPDRYTPARFA